MREARHRSREQNRWPCPKAHDDLARDLARFLRLCRARATWERVEMRRPPDFRERLDRLVREYGVPFGGRFGFEADVYSIVMTGNYRRANPAAYEVKVSREDFRREMAAGKWVGMCLCADKAWFAVPEGLVVAEEVPSPCGLLVRRERPSAYGYAWKVAKPARSLGHDPVPDMLMKLALRPFWRERGGQP